MGSGTVDRVLTGSYGALLAGPVCAVLLPRVIGPGEPWLSFVVGAIGGGTVGYGLASRCDVTRWFANRPYAVGLAVVPLGYLVWAIALLAHNPDRQLLTLLVRPGTVGVLAAVPAMAEVSLATRRTTATRIADSTVRASFDVRPAPRQRYITFGTIATGLGVIAGLVVALAVRGSVDVALPLGALVVCCLGLVVIVSGGERTVVLTDDGVAIGTTFVPWDQFDTYRITDRALVVELRRRTLQSFTFDVTEIPALSDVRAIFDEHVPDATQ